MGLLENWKKLYIIIGILFIYILLFDVMYVHAETLDVLEYSDNISDLIDKLSLEDKGGNEYDGFIYENNKGTVVLSLYGFYGENIFSLDNTGDTNIELTVLGLHRGSSTGDLIQKAKECKGFIVNNDCLVFLYNDTIYALTCEIQQDLIQSWTFTNLVEGMDVGLINDTLEAQNKYNTTIYDYQWKIDYIDYIIYTLYCNEFNGYMYLAYVNDDDIPELYIHTDGTASGDKMCTWSANGIKEQFIWTGCGSYIERANLFAELDGGHMGLYTDKVYSIENDDFKSIANGERIEVDGGGSGTFEQFVYKWNDVEVSESEYDSNLKSAYDASKAIAFKDLEKNETENNFKKIIEEIVAVDDSENSQSTQQENENLKEGLITKEYEAEYHNPDYGKGSILIKYDENDFFSDSSTYNHHLACYAASLSTMVYSNNKHLIKVLNEFEYNNGNVTEDKNFFDDDTIGDGAKNKGIDEIGISSPCCIAHKSLKIDGKKTDIINVIIRGTADEEWINNFKIGKGSDVHEGFQYACNDIKSKLEKYISDNDLEKDDIRLLITGHSRGAAVANLLGASIDDDGIANTNVKPSDVYVYTFATPNTTAYQYASVDPFQKEKDNSVYNNINNIVNPEDFVTKVVPSKWGFRRYGCTYVLPSKTTDTTLRLGAISYSYYLLKVNEKFQQYTNDGSLYVPYSNGMLAVSDYIRDITLVVKNVDEYYNKNLNALSMLTGNRHLYSLEELFTFILGGTCSNNSVYEEMASTVIKEAAKARYGYVGYYTLVFFGINHMAGEQAHKLDIKSIDSSFKLAHTSETYLAQMNTISEKDLLKKRRTVWFIVNCPVDVTIKDEDGNVVGEIKDNQVNEDIEDGVFMSVDGDSKRFSLPQDDEFKIELTGNDNGTMDYSLCYVDADTGEIERTYYQDVPIENGKTYYQEVKSGDLPKEIDLINSNNDVVEPTDNLDQDSFGQLTVEVMVEGVGSADSLYGLTPGDYVTLTAVTDQNNSFLGWYDENGNLVSTDDEYAFSIKENMKFTAKFTDVIVDVESITFDKNKVIMKKGDTAYNIPQVMPENATSQFLVFESSNTNVVEVDEYGLLTAIGGGEATITAKSADGKAEASFAVAVTDDENSTSGNNESGGDGKEKTSPLLIAGIISLIVIILISIGIIIFQVRKDKYFTEKTLYGDMPDVQEEEKPETEVVGIVQGVFGVGEGKQFVIKPGQSCSVGKSSECNIQIKSNIVSRLHCTIRMLSEEVFEVTDNSTNGTFYNNVRLEKGKPINVPKDSILALGDANNIIQVTVQEREI